MSLGTMYMLVPEHFESSHYVSSYQTKTKGTHIIVIGEVEWNKQLANPMGSNIHWVQ